MFTAKQRLESRYSALRGNLNKQYAISKGYIISWSFQTCTLGKTYIPIIDNIFFLPFVLCQFPSDSDHSTNKSENMSTWDFWSKSVFLTLLNNICVFGRGQGVLFCWWIFLFFQIVKFLRNYNNFLVCVN